jgi:DNA-binding FrmR family transcriptional regulator
MRGRSHNLNRKSLTLSLPTSAKDRPTKMSQTKREKLKLLNRVRRVRGQIKAVERAIEEEQSCSTVLHLIVASRGAMSSLMTELIEDHVRHMWSTQ